MADSSIVITNLTAVGGTKEILVTLEFAEGSCLPYMTLDRIEIWASATNNRAAATNRGDADGRTYTHKGLADDTTRYYWSRPRDKSGNYGDWHPANANAGVVATTFKAVVQSDDIDAIIDENTTVTGIAADLGERFAASQIQFRTAQTAKSGYAATLELIAKALSQAGSMRRLGMLFDLPIGNGLGRVRLLAGSQFVVEDSDGEAVAVFSSDGKVRKAVIPLIEADMIRIKQGLYLGVDADIFLKDGTTVTELIANNAVTNIYTAFTAAPTVINGTTTSKREIQRVTITTAGSGSVLLRGSYYAESLGGDDSTIHTGWYKNGSAAPAKEVVNDKKQGSGPTFQFIEHKDPNPHDGDVWVLSSFKHTSASGNYSCTQKNIVAEAVLK